MPGPSLGIVPAVSLLSALPPGRPSGSAIVLPIACIAGVVRWVIARHRPLFIVNGLKDLDDGRFKTGPDGLFTYRCPFSEEDGRHYAVGDVEAVVELLIQSILVLLRLISSRKNSTSGYFPSRLSMCGSMIAQWGQPMAWKKRTTMLALSPMPVLEISRDARAHLTIGHRYSWSCHRHRRDRTPIPATASMLMLWSCGQLLSCPCPL